MVILLRHGKAHADSPTGRDEDRPLKSRGERQAHWIGARLVEAGGVSLVLHSPLVRAVETARIVAGIVNAPMRMEARLAAGRGVDAILAVVTELGGPGSAVLIGHNPDLSDAAHRLSPTIARRRGELRTGEAWAVRCPGGVLEHAWRLDEDDEGG